MTIAIWVAGILLGAAATTIVAWVGLVWWFGDRDLFKKQYPTHRAGDEPEPVFPAPSLVIPANLFPRDHQPLDSGGGFHGPPSVAPAAGLQDSETSGLQSTARGRGDGHPAAGVGATDLRTGG